MNRPMLVVDADQVRQPSQVRPVVDVAVGNANGSGTLPGGYTYHATPTLASVAEE